MANAETLKNAEIAPHVGNVALVERNDVAVGAADAALLNEYAFHGADGSPEGSIWAEDRDEAVELWARENPSFDWIEVWGPSDVAGRWYRIRHERGGVKVTRSNPEPDVGA